MRLLLLLVVFVASPVFVVSPALAQSPSEVPDAQAVLDRIDRTYQTLRAVRATFSQQIGGQTLEGTLAVQGDQFRVELPGQTIVSDGETAWSYAEADNTVLISRVADDPAFFSPGELFLRYPERFDIEVVERTTWNGVLMDVLALAPKNQADEVESATLFVRAADGVPVRVEVQSLGQAVTIALADIRLNPRLDPGQFTFRVPRGAEVIDLRS
ncbi:MAG: outer membrane lipoprotein carrier protein LolA [Bacteroidota bacterium]